MRQPGEPSIEEILESIKQVIARETRPVAAFRDMAPREDESDEDDGEGAVLELSETRYAPQPEPQSTPEPAPLVNEDASRSMRGALGALADVAEHGPQREPAATDGSALEALLRELLRPALADWLDRNLPGIVEKMVAAEITRITGRR